MSVCEMCQSASCVFARSCGEGRQEGSGEACRGGWGGGGREEGCRGGGGGGRKGAGVGGGGREEGCRGWGGEGGRVQGLGGEGGRVQGLVGGEGGRVQGLGGGRETCSMCPSLGVPVGAFVTKCLCTQSLTNTSLYVNISI